MEAFAGFAQNRLYSVLARKAVIPLSGQFDAQAYLPTQPPSPLEDARLPFPYEDQGGRGCAVSPSCQGTAPCLRVAELPRLTQEPGKNPYRSASFHCRSVVSKTATCEFSHPPDGSGMTDDAGRSHTRDWRLHKHADYQRVY